jgi:thioredoxin-like negative regulator of GroEL
MKNIKVIRIDVDKHADLVKSFEIQEIPILRVYKQGIVTWEQKGYVEKEIILKNLK